ncbi:MAG: hypothetical protein KBT18_12590 [Comamonas sp.]|nr:hypothetical protein [Candidatus Comamonas equi]
MLKQGFRWSLTSLLCVVLSGCLATGGAMNTGESGDASSTELDVAGDLRLTSGTDAKFFSNSGFQSCIVAGGGTAALCLLIGKAPKQCLVPALAACGVAMGANYYLDQRRAQYADKTQRLNAMTSDVKADSDNVAMRSNTMKNVLKDDKARMVAIEKSIRTKNVNAQAARKELAQIDKNIALMKKELGVMKDKSSGYQEVLAADGYSGNTNAKSNTSSNKNAKNNKNTKNAKNTKANEALSPLDSMNAEVQKLARQVESLEQEINSVYAQRSAITLG